MTAAGALAGRAVTIIGAGIGGLAAAIALAQRGAQVVVREQAGALREVGAGVQVSPNAGRVLDALGLGSAFADISTASRFVVLRRHDGHTVLRMALPQRAGAGFRTVHRARLVEMLNDAAHKAGVIVHLDERVEAPPADETLVIGADGLHSIIRAALNGPSQPFFTGQTAWRAIIPLEPGAEPGAQVFMGPGCHLVSYPLADGLRNIVAVREQDVWTAQSWSHEDAPDNLRAAFAAFGGPVPGWLNAVERCGHWGLFRYPVAERWHDGRLAILGDAAHPTLPFLAQGACMAIEDAWVLAACLAADSDQPRALARYQALRQPRCSRIVAAANANARNYHLSGARRIVAHGLLRTVNRLAPKAALARFGWVYDHDPTQLD